jgi:hypothetical protein
LRRERRAGSTEDPAWLRFEQDRLRGRATHDGLDYGIQGVAMLVRPLNLGAALGEIDGHG